MSREGASANGEERTKVTRTTKQRSYAENNPNQIQMLDMKED
jgi:hypothetical protein